MSDFTEEDREYRNAGVREAWNVGRAMKGDPIATVKRRIVTGGNPAIGDPGTETDAPGFPVDIPVHYRSIVGTELQDLAGLESPDAVRLTAFDFEFDSEDVIELYEKEYRIFANEFERGTGASRLILVPRME